MFRHKSGEAQRYHDYALTLSKAGNATAAAVMFTSASNVSTYHRLRRVSEECAKRYATHCHGEARWRRQINEGDWDELTTLLAILMEGMWAQYAGLAGAAHASA